MREQPDAWTELRHDLDTQKALLAALGEGSERPLSERLSELPVHGAVHVQSQTWDYTRHGAGVSSAYGTSFFSNHRSGQATRKYSVSTLHG